MFTKKSWAGRIARFGLAVAVAGDKLDTLPVYAIGLLVGAVGSILLATEKSQ